MQRDRSRAERRAHITAVRLSLCVVARSEPIYLRACLEHARPAADELIVVLMESADHTAEVARAAGARVIQATSPGDRAQAHNLSIGSARGEWILALADTELLSPGAGPEIRRLTGLREYEAFLFSARSYSYSPTMKWRPADSTDPLTRGAPGYSPTRAVHLFRRRPGYAYAGPNHPEVGSSILARGGRIGEADVLIHDHERLVIGGDPFSQLHLQRRHVVEAPKNAAAWLDLGAQLLEYSDPAAALPALRRARSLGAGPIAMLLMADAHAELDEFPTAIRLLRAAIRENPRDEIVDFDRADAWIILAGLHEASGRPGDAEALYRKALGTRPGSPAALNNLAALLGERGAVDEAERLLRRLSPHYRGLAMPWATRGTLQLRGGDLDGALRSFETALEIDPGCLPARINIALTHQRAGRPLMAKRAYQVALELRGGRPAAKLGLRTRSKGTVSSPLRRRAAGSGRVVVSIIDHLAGGGGRVLVDVVKALPDRAHLVLCGDADAYLGIALREELETAGAAIQTIGSAGQLRSLLERARPETVIQHWWPNRILAGPLRCRGPERWIAYGHSGRSLPDGYDAYVVVSDYHRRFQGHLPPERIHCIPNAVDLSLFRPRRTARRGPVTIVMLSRLDTGKFPRRLLDYLPSLPDLGARLVVAGRGRRRHEIEPELEGRGLAKVVRFCGALPSAAVPDFMCRADIGLHLNEAVSESGSIAIKQMLAAGLPVVAQPEGCVPELVADGRNGFLAADGPDVAARLRELILSPRLRRRMGEASRRHAEAFDAEPFRAAVRRLVDGPCEPIG